ncbi:hypothetical protein PDIG_56880 [Penicillium digitatum PHI26]|uniref:Uncharacterized protein n=2 Tax=Penicillium digitatum TaxID=36651 RepID=K9FMG6_PEND2|nr:hypothetical protein PDIP_66440 [Penicillium digitatum Pd1]EKV09133.1 hypothetical protein PDIP_66440 [Penicillium digitatum Pd1]EKV10399.1 hypothetical protein PDIG_56880 [Penicillium digitatum PHI26]
MSFRRFISDRRLQFSLFDLILCVRVCTACHRLRKAGKQLHAKQAFDA